MAVEDNELRAYFARIDEQFARIDGRFTAVDDKLAETNNRITTGLRHVGVEIEGLRAAMQLNNELIYAVDQKLERFRVETKDNFKTVYDVIGASHTQLISRIRS
jgi:hypothetical protein